MRAKEGHLVTVDVPSSATRFAQVKVGDTVTIWSYDRVVIRLKPAGEPAVDRTLPPTTTPAAGSAPGGTLASQRSSNGHADGLGCDKSRGVFQRTQWRELHAPPPGLDQCQTSSQD